MPVELSLAGKTALITGGSRGIGAAAVRMFVAAGAQVVFNYHRARQQAEELARECGGGCIAVQADLDSAESAGALVRAAIERFGALDVLVANHGVWPNHDAPIDAMPEAQWHSTISINLDSVFGLVKHAVAQMKTQASGGKIVLISSTAGQRGEAFHCDYAATKGALISMVKGLATELARHRIYVNCVAPGWVATDMSLPVMADRAYAERVNATIPLGRIGKPEEIAAPILFLCTEHAGFITGEIFNVNGGAVLVG
ncbi:MAG TPA: SDR family NAD(P)-dependent oxidoreductase [Terriglobales bacterium]|nr:SDR family NAD(P)-dependent oxidoreductase [Terriglobales bacterium]